MGSFERHHDERRELRDVPRGCLAVLVGVEDKQRRFVIPVFYVNHPLFVGLLKEAENEYGFDQKGPITIPCRVEDFLKVQGEIQAQEHHLQNHNHCFRS